MKIRLLLMLVAALFCGANAAAEDAEGAAEDLGVTAEVRFETTMGEFTVEVYPEKAPETVKNFLQYANDGFYDGTVFHRVVPEFVIQAGGYTTGLLKKPTREPVKNESLNGLKNVRGSLAMARKRMPDSATSQFYINLANNDALDPRGTQFGYTVFGKVTDGMDVIDKIGQVETDRYQSLRDVPKEEILIQSAKQISGPGIDEIGAEPAAGETRRFVVGKHYLPIVEPLETSSKDKLEVVEVFSYGCPHCYSFEEKLQAWEKGLGDDVAFVQKPAVWNGLMRLYATAYYTTQKLDNSAKLHDKLFAAIVVDGTPYLSEPMFGQFFVDQGVEVETFGNAFDSAEVLAQVNAAAEYTKQAKIIDLPAMIVNGKYYVSATMAGGQEEMLMIVNELLEAERK
ncbi:MAG: hypothetical protein Tsb002_35240 [Wenzhouxiangellaceae bacterium]